MFYLVKRYRVLLLAVCVVGLGMMPGTAAVAQTAQRVVQGTVVNGSDAPIKGAVVYLKNDRTLTVKSYLAGNDGSYRFGQISQDADYDLWAEKSGKKSSVRNISSFDTRKLFIIVLKIK